MATVTSRARVSPAPPGREADRRETRDELLDTTVRLVTPERIVFQYPIAGPFRRSLGYLLDFFVTILIITACIFVLNILTFWSMSGMGPLFVVMFLVNWGYGGFCEGFLHRPHDRQVGDRRALPSPQGVPITGAQAVLPEIWSECLDGPIPPVFWTLVAPPTMIPPFFFLIGCAQHWLDPSISLPGRPRGGDDGGDRGIVNARVGVVRVTVTPERRQRCFPGCRYGSRRGRRWARAFSDYVRRRENASQWACARRWPGARRARSAQGGASACRPTPRPTTSFAALCITACSSGGVTAS